MIDDLKKSLDRYSGSWSEKNGIHEFKVVIAEVKAFLATKKLDYSARVQINDENKTVAFSEMLKESGAGFTSGSIDGGISTGFGFKTETYNTFSGKREGTIEESVNIFGKKYKYTFDYKEIRNKVEEIARQKGYVFTYQVLPL